MGTGKVPVVIAIDDKVNTGNLSIKKVVNGEGKLETIAKKHGVKKAASYLVEKFNDEYDPNYKTVYISHADCIDTANYIKEKAEYCHEDHRLQRHGCREDIRC